MGSLLAALDEESMENQRDVVKNERRQRYDNVPYGTAFEKLTALAYPEGHPYHHTPIGSMADLDAASLEDARSVLPHVLRARTTPSSRSSATSTPSRRWPGSRSTSAPSPRTTASSRPRDGALPDVIGEQLREVVEEEVPGPRADGRLPAAAGRHPRVRRRRPGADRPRRRRVVPALQPSGPPRPHRRRRRLRPAAAGRRALAGLAGREDVRRRRGARSSRRPSTRSWPGSPPRAPRRRRWSAPRPSWSASGWTGSARSRGRADELCRFAVLFGDPQLALTAVQRVLDVTAEEVQEVAAARLRPDNRAVLVYEPTAPEPTTPRTADETAAATRTRPQAGPQRGGRQ